MVAAYLTHPIGDDDSSDAIVQRNDNLANAMQWVRFLVLSTRWAISCPWLVYLMATDQETLRARSMRDQVELLHRSDVLILCGGRISYHMEILRNHARNRIEMPIPVLDLTDLGRSPPFDDIDKSMMRIRSQARAIGL